MKQKIIALFTLLGLFSALVMPVQAALITTPEVIAIQQSEQQRAQLFTQLDREEVRSQLEKLGVTADQLQSRIDSMTDIEIAQLNQQLESLPTGSSAVGVVLVVFVVLVITDAIGITDVFPFIRPGR